MASLLYAYGVFYARSICIGVTVAMLLREAYATLEVSEGASLAVVRRAYRGLALHTHPDMTQEMLTLLGIILRH